MQQGEVYLQELSSTHLVLTRYLARRQQGAVELLAKTDFGQSFVLLLEDPCCTWQTAVGCVKGCCTTYLKHASNGLPAVLPVAEVF